jgi:DNA-binding NarL/FixJ family response regulator
MNRRELLKALSAIPLLPMILNGRKAWAHGTTINPARKPQQQVRLVIVDDHEIMRDGLRRFLEAQPDMKVIGAVSNTAEAMKLVRQFKPDILTTDLSRPNDSGFHTLRELNATPVRVIVLTANDAPSLIVEAFQLGARGYVLKTFSPQVLLKAIQTVKAGEYWVGREQFSNLEQCLRTQMQSIDDEARRRRDQARRLKELSPRELEIVSAVVYLLPTYNRARIDKEIAEHLKISEDTVKHHLRNIFDKLGVSTRLELALFAVNQGLPLKPIV